MKRTAILMAVLVALAGVAPAVAAHDDAHAQAESYSGAHISFETESNAVADYAVNGEELFDSVAVQSQSEVGADGSVEAGAEAASDLRGAGLSVASQTEASVRLESEGSAALSAHDNERGHLVITAGEDSQYVAVNVSDDSEAEQDDDRVVVTTSNGTTGTFIVVGDGEVTVTEEGDVNASLEENSTLVFRSNGDERDEEDREQEQLIAEGQSAAEVHVMERGGEAVTDVVTYGQDTTVEVAQQSQGTVELTVDRATHEGTVLITSVSEAAVGSVENVSVTVDGEAAAEASSYGELRSAADGGDQSAYMVSESNAEANADVLVAVNHFSERSVALSTDEEAANGDATATDADDADGDDENGDDGDSSGDETPGFGVVAALVALLAAALVARRRE